ncbi:MAG: BtpA/SgcQ family protein [Planctomycetales bacterium]|nr:BtpA/SgcQ family protein [Planctomycetales bacterium]
MLSVWKSISHPVIGMLHLPALPGAPRGERSLDQIREAVLQDADTLLAGGVNGLMLENFGDVPFFPRRVAAHTVAAMTAIGVAVRERFEAPLGINVLRNDGLSALAIAAAIGADFIRVNVLSGARVTDQGIIEGIAHDLLRERRMLNAGHVLILTDVNVKHSAPLAARPIEEEVSDLVERAGADALIVTGAATGTPAGLADVTRVRKASQGMPILVGSGVITANVEAFLPLANGFIIGSEFKRDRQVHQPVDPRRVAELIGRIRQHDGGEANARRT